MEDVPHLQKLKPVSWEEIYSTWKEDEFRHGQWKGHWEGKGFDSWEEWRNLKTKLLHLPDREWNLYSVEDPVQTVPTFWGGPFLSLAERYYDGDLTKQISEIALHQSIKSHERIRKIMENFPSYTQLIGLIWNNRILIYEGTHRACAIALAASDNVSINSEITIALTDISDISENELREVSLASEKRKTS